MPLFYFDIKLKGSGDIAGSESLNFEDEASARAYASGIVSTFQNATSEGTSATVMLRDETGATIGNVVADQSAEILDLAKFSKSALKTPPRR